MSAVMGCTILLAPRAWLPAPVPLHPPATLHPLLHVGSRTTASSCLHIYPLSSPCASLPCGAGLRVSSSFTTAIIVHQYPSTDTLCMQRRVHAHVACRCGPVTGTCMAMWSLNASRGRPWYTIGVPVCYFMCNLILVSTILIQSYGHGWRAQSPLGSARGVGQAADAST
ncbi:hypothetical protein BD311DRAFT_506097 [Dichomitus squalens]|uniref:Uncharacterized protein n=1 Tax=Dichomitus squalens TaxID=114155 RepID=A0A4Q9MF08_9APHY|nr:hypothetical protein BD311DRAFT_506097 [Dichomitus squalens]